MTLVVLGLLGMRIEVLPGMHLASWPVTTARTLQKLRRSSKVFFTGSIETLSMSGTYSLHQCKAID